MKNTANILTLARIVLMPIPCWLMYGGASQLFVGLAVILVLGLTDWIDGIVARRQGPTVLGGLLDPIADKVFIALIYLPLSERFVPEWGRTVVPLWMTVCIFVRDFLVTALRTSLFLRAAPMRTSFFAKLKTGAQMLGIGYVIIYYAAFLSSAGDWLTYAAVFAPLSIPLALIVYRAVLRKKQGRRSVIMAALMAAEAAARLCLGPELASWLTLLAIVAVTIASGLSYLTDAWTAIRGKPRGVRELGRFALDGILVPLAFLLLLGRSDAPFASGMIISSISLELVAGGIANLLASRQVAPKFRWIAAKSMLQISLCGAALAEQWGFTTVRVDSDALLATAFAVTLIFGLSSVMRHRAEFLRALR